MDDTSGHWGNHHPGGGSRKTGEVGIDYASYVDTFSIFTNKGKGLQSFKQVVTVSLHRMEKKRGKLPMWPSGEWRGNWTEVLDNCYQEPKNCKWNSDLV